jgi:hypothetical protein
MNKGEFVLYSTDASAVVKEDLTTAADGKRYRTRVQKSVLIGELFAGKRRVRNADAHVGPKSVAIAG